MDNLRDKFAMAAMQGLISDGWMKDQENIATHAYRQADLMIAEREKESDVVVMSGSAFRELRADLIDCKSQLKAIYEASK
ncbi:hypothetical protein SKM54_04635 [Acinetobacter faecalis]|uniref:hypothetical protein n=1 Tax=Acinetobacter faecalis TaxID=2665161 RepID=UPI002A908E27|nr:hypothetical protein [Acinetobacter faecalis]MDY6481737.1 hypothetical protein [Acinetobacter faecalis]